MPSFLFEDLTQRLPKVLEPRYETLYFENGDFIPTMTDLSPGAREIAYERISEFGDADLVSDATTNIPIVDISVDEDRYNIYMIASGFPLSFQEERAYEANLSGRTTNLNRYERRMSAARKVIAQRVNYATAFGYPQINFPGALTHSNVPRQDVGTGAGGYDPATATYSTMLAFLVNIIEAMTDNLVSMEPTQMLVPPAFRRRMITLENANGTRTVAEAIASQFPNLEITKTRECAASGLDAFVNGTAQSGLFLGNTGMAIPGRPAGRDRIMLYPKEPSVLNRHIEQTVAELAPPEYQRVDGLRKIYPMFSCITPTIIDYPQDCRYFDLTTTPIA